MSNKETAPLVPKLRFSEFQGKEGWKAKRLGLVLKFQAGFPFPSAGFGNTGKGLRLIRNRDLRSDDIVVFYSGEFDPNFVVSNGDVLVGMDGDFTPTVWEKGKALLNQRVGRILPLENSSQQFLLYLLTLCLKGVEAATARTTVKHLSHSAIEEKRESLPSLAEQQRIAACLSSLDELIAAQARKVNALKTRKKGLMQQLFPREGETQPSLRFPKLQGAPTWERRTFGRLATFFNGRAYKQEELLESGEYRVLRVGNFFSNKSWYYSDLQLEDSKYCGDGDLLYAWSASFGPRIWSGERVIYHYHIWKVIPKAGIDKIFLFILLGHETERMKSQSANGLGLMHITKGAIEAWECCLPSSAEQKRIADCLGAVDTLIASETQKLESLKTHKNGLMQQLFPLAEAVEA